MRNIEELRKKLHSAMRMGNKEEILKISQELDVAIINFLRENKGQAAAQKKAYTTTR